MQTFNKIVPHLWFDKETKEAVAFYCSVFPDSKVISMATIRNTPSGDCDLAYFQLAGHSFIGISAGPAFKINPSISFFVNFDPSKNDKAREDLDKLWEKLSEGGTALMELGEYPFSKHYGWIQDRYGVSWQLMLTNPEGEARPFITPSMMFVGEVAGKAEEATDFYISVFKNSKRGNVYRYPQGMEPDKEGTLMYTDFELEGQWFAAMDSAHAHQFQFNEALSFLIECESQDEIDYYWQKLSAVPEAEQCGWCKDQYGCSWQVSSAKMNQMLREASQEQLDRVMEVFMKMKKVDIAKLEEAYNG